MLFSCLCVINNSGDAVSVIMSVLGSNSCLVYQWLVFLLYLPFFLFYPSFSLHLPYMLCVPHLPCCLANYQIVSFFSFTCLFHCLSWQIFSAFSLRLSQVSPSFSLSMFCALFSFEKSKYEWSPEVFSLIQHQYITNHLSLKVSWTLHPWSGGGESFTEGGFVPGRWVYCQD